MALTMKNIKVIFEKIIKPSCPTPNHLRRLPASLFDHVNSPVLVPLIFFFKPQKNICTTEISTNEVLDRLKGSLPSTLSLFYPLAGRVQDVDHINCNDEGVPYVQAEVDMPLEDVVHKAEVSQLDNLLPPYGQQVYTSLLLAIQVNVFACGGLAIGVMMSHAVADGFSILMFVETWASIAKGKDPNTLLQLPYFEIWKLYPPLSTQINGIDMYDDKNPNLMPDKHVTKWFVFSETRLHSIRSKLLSFINNINEENNNGESNYKISRPSLAMVLSAFIWSRIMVVCHANLSNHMPCEVVHSVNLRPRVSPPNEKSYHFGNMYTLAISKPSIVLHNDDINSCNDPLWYEFLWQTEKSIAKLISKDGSFMKGIEKGTEDLSYIMEHYDRKRNGEIVSMDFSNLRSLPVYEADFGWGKPVWVASGSQKYKDFVILINAAPSSKDVMAYVCLSIDDMAKLERDAVFNEFVSVTPCIQKGPSTFIPENIITEMIKFDRISQINTILHRDDSSDLSIFG